MPLNDTLTPASLRPRLPESAQHLTDEQLQARIDDALALAEVYAPCITANGFTKIPAALAVIRGAIVYDATVETGSDIQTESVGPYSKTRFTQTRSGTFYSPSQIDALRALCASTSSDSTLVARGVYSVSLMPPHSAPRAWRGDRVW